MKKKGEHTSNKDFSSTGISAEYLSPVQVLPEHSAYPLSLLVPIFVKSVSAAEKDYVENIPHKHTEFELIYVVKGSIDIGLDNMSVHVAAGDGACIKRGVAHSIDPDTGGDTEIILVHFHHSVLFGSVITLLSSRNLTNVLGSDEYSYLTFDHNTEDGAAIVSRIQAVYDNMSSDKPGSELRAIGALFDIWGLGISDRAEISTVPLTKQQTLDKWRIERATEYIAAHYAEDILLSDIASCCEVSESECCRTFKRALHSSPIDYINRYRVYAAAEMLTNDMQGTPMSDIASKVGFNYASYFNKTFKRYIGMTPMQYRKKFNKSDSLRKNQHEFRI